MSIEQKVREILSSEVEKLNCRIYDVVYERVGNDSFLRIFLDSDQPIDLEKCVEVTEVISPILDEHDPISEVYYLEVASKGAEPELKTKDDILASIGEYVYIKTYEKIDKMKEFTGDLMSFDGENVEVKCNIKGISKTYEIPYKKIAKIRISVHL